MAFLGSFVQYVLILILLAAIGAVGMYVGVVLRKRKDAQVTASNRTKE